MIIMKSVRGPAVYVPSTGYDVTIGELEEIHVSSGNMVMAQVLTSSVMVAIPSSVSGNIVTLIMQDSRSGLMVYSDTSTILSATEIAVIADGY